MGNDDVYVVLCTAPAEGDVAANLARGIIEARLAACVNLIGGLRSFYRWESEVKDDPEVQLLMKTTAARLPALKAHLSEHHPYDVPEVLALPVAEGGEAYLAWVREETRA